MILEIKNWNIYNPRKDVKHNSWFRLDHNLFSDYKLFEFSAEEITAWIYILCCRSQSKKDEFEVNFEHASTVARIKRKILNSAIDKLLKLHMISIIRNEHERVRTDPCSTYVRTDVTNEQTGSLKNERLFFDLEALYSKYPRKMGKTKGMEKLKTIIKTQEIYNKVSLAIDNYHKHCISEKTESKYIKHFSTFVNTWEDAVELKIEVPKQRSLNGETNPDLLKDLNKPFPETNPKIVELIKQAKGKML